jgi:hypothetical protein
MISAFLYPTETTCLHRICNHNHLSFIIYNFCLCTVTFLPTASGFILTSNRDESPVRAAITLPPQSYQLINATAYFPKDPQGGTWIAVSGEGRMHCLLNGAFEKHVHQPPYRKSRGIVVLDSLEYDIAEQFASDYDFSGIEPFTLVMVNSAGLLQLHEFRWDGKDAHLKILAAGTPHIWSSASLYDQTARKKREEVFQNWLQRQSTPNPDAVLDLHLNGGVGDPKNNFRMDRGGMVQTVSVTQVLDSAGKSLMRYRDLLHETLHQLELY